MVQQHENVRQAIDQVNAQFMQAFNRGDAASATAAAYREDATILPPGAARISGRDAISQFWQGAMAMGVRQVALQTQELQVSGDHAYEIGVATLTLQPAGGPASTDTAKYVVVWQRDHADWRWAVDIWNSNSTAA